MYQTNSKAYEKELQVLDAKTKTQIAVMWPAKRKIITSHDAFGCLSTHYGIQFLAPQSVSTEAESSAKEMV